MREWLYAYGEIPGHWLQMAAAFVNQQIIPWIDTHLLSGHPVEWFTTAVTSFVLISAAEIGDKSQIVCMTLAARHRGAPVLFGASCAFGILNLAAVLFGTAVASWVPEKIITMIVALLFSVFGIHAFLARHEEEDEATQTIKSGHGIFFSTFLLISFAEFGDKTQLTVAGLGSTALPTPVWLGSTAALATTSALGVWAGRTLLQRIPIHFLHKISGILFLLLAGLAFAHVASLL